MGRATKRKTRDVYDDDDVRRGLRPGAAALLVVAVGLGGMITWNAFYGKHQSRSIESLLAEIPPGASTSVSVEAPGKASRSITIKYDPDVEDMQRELLATGHYRGLVDGVIGNRTVIAIRAYQKDRGLSIDGKVSRDLIDRVRFERKVASISDQTNSIAPLPAAITPKPETADNLAVILDVQMRLTRLGYEPGKANGLDSEETRAAILKFELDNGLAMEGRINKPLLAALQAVESGRALAAQ